MRGGTAASRGHPVEHDLLAAGQRCGGEKPREPLHAAHQSLGLDLHLQIGPAVGAQILDRIVRVVDRGDAADVDRAHQVPIRHLRGHEREQAAGARAAAEQVDAAAPELRGVAGGQHEPQSSTLDQVVDLVEQAGELLDLIDDHRTGCGIHGRQLRPQPPGLAREVQEHLAVQQVEPRRSREQLIQIGGLARLARAEEEHGPRGEIAAEVEPARSVMWATYR